MKKTLLLLFSLVYIVVGKSQTADSLTVVRAKWQIDSLEGMVLKRIHFTKKNLFGSNQYISVLEIPADSPNRLALSYEPKRTLTSEHAKRRGALAAINGSFFDMALHNPICYLRIDGQELGENTPQKTDSIHRKYYQYGSLKLNGGRPEIFIPDSLRNSERELKDSNIMTAGPLLVYKGRFVEMRGDKTFVSNRHNRTAIGVKRDGTILLVTVDGRTRESEGLSLQDFQKLLRYIGCHDALNLDGGGSTTMYIKGFPHGGIVTHPTDNGKWDFEGERGVSNCILVVK
jgi:exopolysaccharide biosynthesis protein